MCGPMLWPAASLSAESGTAATLEAELVQVTGCNTLNKVFEAKLGDKTMLVQVGDGTGGRPVCALRLTDTDQATSPHDRCLRAAWFSAS